MNKYRWQYFKLQILMVSLLKLRQKSDVGYFLFQILPLNWEWMGSWQEIVENMLSYPHKEYGRIEVWGISYGLLLSHKWKKLNSSLGITFSLFQLGKFTRI